MPIGLFPPSKKMNLTEDEFEWDNDVTNNSNTAETRQLLEDEADR